MKIDRGNEDAFWVTFKYERLPTFCFFCGLLGHSDRFCPIMFETKTEDALRPYGQFMRAPDRRAPVRRGSRWLRDGMANPLHEDSDIGDIFSSDSVRNAEASMNMELDKVKGHDDSLQIAVSFPAVVDLVGEEGLTEDLHLGDTKR